MEDGAKALLAVNAGACTPAVENIIEANTYLSGIGFESGGIAAAHAIHNGLTCIEETHGMYHGEKVAFGVLSQLVLENVSTEDLEEVVEFCINIGLPVTFEELGIKKLDEEKLMEAATLACAEGDTVTTTKITNKINYFNKKRTLRFCKVLFMFILNYLTFNWWKVFLPF